MSNPLADMEKPDAILCIGTNMTECHPVAATRLKRAVAKGARLVVADPRRIPLADLAELYLPIRVGSDTALLLAMAHVIAEEGLVDEAFIAERTVGYQTLREHLRQFTPDWAAPICRVSPAHIAKAARIYAGAGRAAIYYTLGITEHICGVDNVQSLCNLALMTGNLGKEGAGINPMRGQNNIQGAGDCGALPVNFPGYQPCDDPEAAARFSQLYGREIAPERGITKVHALDLAAEGRMKAMLICGENTVVSDPDRNHCEHALRNLDHLVVVDLFPNETTALADVVLPATAWGETDGVYTNTERRVQRVRAAVPPQGDARPDWWIVSQLARRLGLAGFDYESAKDVFNELCSVSPTYAGLDWDRIDRGEYQWPVPDKDHPGTPILHRDGFKNGRGRFNMITYRDPAEVVDDEYPVWLTTGRRLEAYHTRTMSGRAAGMDYLLSEESLEVHPDDVATLGLVDGGFARVTSRRGSVVLRVRADDTSPRGTVFCSFSFGDVPVNVLTGGGYDPVTFTAELKVCPVRVEPAEPPA
ncbi:MAG: molybdopterin-dependent oxidoreductase [Planctomycetes bacterium]|nr:molybdopterin-dependent oxidoreductase [Planctomycetota bacterium]